MKSFSKNNVLNRGLLFRISCVLAVMLLLLLSPSAALKGAASGLALWYRTLFPTLMPFMVLSNFIIYTGCAKPLGTLLEPLTRLLRLPKSAGYCIITGFLCGYPMGAYVCGNLNEIGELDDDTAAFLAPVCNNVSPMFIVSYICMSCLNDRSLAKPVIALLSGSAAVGMFLLRFICLLDVKRNNKLLSHTHHPHNIAKVKKNGTDIERESSPSAGCMSTSEAISRSVDSALMASLKLCIYVMLFSIAGEMIDNISFLPDIIKAAVMSIMEITAGLDKISMLDISFEYKLLMMLTFTAFGGMSSIFQTMSLWSKKNFNIGKYVFCKIIISMITALSVLFVTITGLL